MIVRTREMSIISANIFDFTARNFFRREDLSIFIDHMINYKGSTQPLFYTSRNKQQKIGCSRCGYCSCSVFCCALIILMGREKLVALVSLSSCVSGLLCCSSLRCHELCAVCDCGIS